MVLKRALRAVPLRCLNAARAEEAILNRECAQRHTVHGDRCRLDFPALVWRRGTRLTLGDNVDFRGVIDFERENATVSIGCRTYFGSMISCSD
jgi:hypothetical protein